MLQVILLTYVNIIVGKIPSYTIRKPKDIYINNIDK